jgi:hypothetical protein
MATLLDPTDDSSTPDFLTPYPDPIGKRRRDATPPLARPEVDPTIDYSGEIAQPSYIGMPAPSAQPPGVALPDAERPSMAQTVGDIGEQAATPSPLGPVFGSKTGHSRWGLTQAPGNYEQVPSYAQSAAGVAEGIPGSGRGLTKLGKIAAILQSLGTGAMVGSTQPTFGTGALAQNQFGHQEIAQQQAQEQGQIGLQQARANLALFPYLQRLGMMKTQADIQNLQASAGKAGAEAQKATAEAGAIPTKTALEQAQAEAANFKEDPNLGLIDLRTRMPVTGDAGLAPLSADEAAILGKQEGDRVPLKLKNTANEMLNRGIRTTTANGRSLLIDNKGNVIKDMGMATPAFTIQQGITGAGMIPGGTAPNRPAPTNAPGGWVSGEGRTLNDIPSPIRGQVQAILDYRHADPPIASRNNPTMQAINWWVNELDPQHDSTQFPARNKILNEYAKDANTGEIGAINTALGHLGDLYQASQALSQNNLPLLHSIASKWGVATGGTAESVYTAILHKVGPEMTKAYLKSGGTEGERGSNEEDFSLSKGQRQIQDNIYESANLLNSKLASKRNAWEKTYQPYRDQDHFDARWITPEAQQTLQQLGSRSPVATPSQTTHSFDAKAWAAANPGGNVDAAIQKAKKQGWQIVNSPATGSW